MIQEIVNALLILAIVAIIAFAAAVLLYDVAADHVNQHKHALIAANRVATAEDVKTGDLLLFASASHPVSLWVETCTTTYTYHVGVAVKQPSGVHVWEIGPNARCGRATLIPLEEKMMSHPGDYVVLRSLNKTVHDADIKRTIENLSHVQYNFSCVAHGASRFIETLIGNQTHHRKRIGIARTNTMYCSQLVQRTYQELGLLPLGDNMLPADFTEAQGMHDIFGHERLLTRYKV